jgi:hypothetical protein
MDNYVIYYVNVRSELWFILVQDNLKFRKFSDRISQNYIFLVLYCSIVLHFSLSVN